MGFVGMSKWMGAPFVFHTYKARPMSSWVPLTAKEKATIAARLQETNNCQTLEDRVTQQLHDSGIQEPHQITQWLLRSKDSLEEIRCHIEQGRLREGGYDEDHFDPLKYLALNAGTAVSVFGAIYGLAFLLPALARRYWQWLNT
jgi:hypothetical protein